MSDKSTCAENLVFEVVASTVSKTVAAPLVTIKTRMQVGTSKLNSPIDCFLDVVNKGGYSALWRGNLWDCIRYFPTRAFNCWSKDKAKKFFPKREDDDVFTTLSKDILYGTAAGGISLLFLHPFDLVDTIVQVDRILERNEYTGTFQAMQSMVQNHGVQSLWRGFGVSVAGIVLYRGAYFGLYDALKPNDATDLQKFAFGYFVTVVAGLISYPLDTIRRRQMIDGDSVYESVTSIWRDHGIMGFYWGVGLDILRGMVGVIAMCCMNKAKAAYIKARSSVESSDVTTTK